MRDEQEIREALERAAAVMPAAPVSYSEVMRRAGVQRWKLAAGWSVALGLFAAAIFVVQSDLLPMDRRSGHRVAAPPSVASSVPEAAATAAGDPVEAAQRWIEAIARGRRNAAWKLLGPTSKSRHPKRFFMDEARSWSGGVGVWADASYADWYATPIASSGEGTVYSVTVAGTLPDGAKGTHTVLVRELAGEARVETSSGGDGSAFIQPLTPAALPGPVSLDETGESRPQLLRARPTFEAEVARHARSVHVVLVDLPGATGHEAKIESNGRDSVARWRPAESIPAGFHVLAMFVEHDDGGIAASSALFEVRS